ncbi:MAG TPA: hypothetical protein ENK20_04720 [Chromatiales bacterium]|nr:hypothetical protein [Chromatiales bacterium]
MSRIALFFERAQPGSRGGVRQHIQRAEHMGRLIEARFGVPPDPWRWQAKHLRWVLEHALAGRAPATRYHYWRTVRAVAAIRKRWPDWAPHLRGPWTSPDGEHGPRGKGGRPPKLARRGHVGRYGLQDG